MTKPSFMDDLREIKKSWRDPEFRRGFLSGFGPAFLKSFLIYGIIGLIVGYELSRWLG